MDLVGLVVQRALKCMTPLIETHQEPLLWKIAVQSQKQSIASWNFFSKHLERKKTAKII